jgi:hypothetical protein
MFSHKKNKERTRSHKQIAREIIGRLPDDYKCFHKHSDNGSVYIHVRFKYCKLNSHQQLIMRISDHEILGRIRVNLNMVWHHQDSDKELFISECVNKINEYVTDFRRRHGYEKRRVPARSDNCVD